MTVAGEAKTTSGALALPALVAFAAPGLCIGALAVAVAVYLPRYYAGHFGLGLLFVGLAFGSVRLFDTALDPLIGIFMDRTRTRLGRYRIWLALGAPVLMVPVYMLFVPPAPVDHIYLIGWLFAYYIGISLVTLSHLSWASVIAPGYHERSRTFGTIQVIGVIGATAVLVLPVLMARRDGASGAGDIPAMGWFIIGSVAIGVAMALVFTREPVIGGARDERFGLRDYWQMISRPDMARIVVADFCLALGPGWMSALYLFYFHDARGFTIANASKLLLVYIASGVIGAAVISWIAQRIGKHRAQMCASTIYSLGLVSMTLLPRNDFPLTALFMSIMGFFASAFVLLDRAMVADVGDAVRLDHGQHRIGLLYSMITTTQKVAGALSITLSFTVLGLIGYNPREGAINTPAAIHGMELVYLIGPVVVRHARRGVLHRLPAGLPAACRNPRTARTPRRADTRGPGARDPQRRPDGPRPLQRADMSPLAARRVTPSAAGGSPPCSRIPSPEHCRAWRRPAGGHHHRPGAGRYQSEPRPGKEP